MVARWFICSFFVPVLFVIAQGQVLGRMRHVANPSQESGNTLDDLFALLSLARALEEKSTGRLSSTYCPDDVIINLVNALVYTATAHVCPEPWTPTAQPHPHPPYPPMTICPPTTHLPTLPFPPTTANPPTTTHPPTTCPHTETCPPTTTIPQPTTPPTGSCSSNTTDCSMKPIGDNNNGDQFGINENSHVVVDVSEKHHLGIDVEGKKQIGNHVGEKSHSGGDGLHKGADNGEKIPKDVKNSRFTLDEGGSHHLNVNVEEKKQSISKKNSANVSESKSSV